MGMHLARAATPLALAVTLTVGCSDGGGFGPGHEGTGPAPTLIASLPRSPEDQAQLDRLRGEVDMCQDLDPERFVSQHALPFVTALGYTPSDAAGLALIQGSTHALDQGELARLDEHGFVIAERRRFPTFTYGYESIYAQDLPLYVSADSILYAVHRSYDSILQALEVSTLIPELGRLLDGMRARLGANPDPDVDLYVTVAASLLSGAVMSPVAGAPEGGIADLVDGALAAQGMGAVTLFGSPRAVDFSQFEPRGHYRSSEALARYFRAMMWLGRVDLRIIETRPDGTLEFRRRELEAAFALRAAMDEDALGQWQRIHDAIAGFVGRPDSMTPRELDDLVAALGKGTAAEALGLSDEALAQAIARGGYGAQRIASQIMFAAPGSDTLPLAASFMLFGQAYVVDSHVFSNLVYDRVGGGDVRRMMPDPLDVAFAALGNAQAAALLEPDVETFDYAADLCATAALVEGHGADYWTSSLYTLWLAALRALSPVAADLDDPALAGLPRVTATEAWGRRMLNTQMASWAELRHDTLLYAKQSYTLSAACEFPDAYVEPYPAFFEAIATYANDGERIVAGLGLSPGNALGDRLTTYFDELFVTASTLSEMAELQRSGTPFGPAHMAFINEAVHLHRGCGDPEGASGWYARLFFDMKAAVDFDPTIADVHTQPTDATGNVVGHVLHVGTGMPRLMVVTADTCQGPRAYAGLVSSYFERVTSDFERSNDEAWAAELLTGTPEDVPWMQDLVAR